LPVLVLGEPGTGKTLVAQTLHSLSSRGAGRFEPVNCAGISATLFESELFGHERGAFTGAIASRPGRFELAHRGTLFLDEIGDLPLDQQAKILVALQERRVRRIGAKSDVAVDIAVIAATNQDIPRMVADARFRADLFDRLNGFTIRVPPLRDREGDLELLLQRFLRAAAHRARKKIGDVHPDVMAVLRRYHWPGNVRQLDFVVRRMVARARGETLTPDLLPAEVLTAKTRSVAEEAPPELPSKSRIEAALAAHDGNVRRTAEHLRISRTRLYRLMAKHRITSKT
jgi:two-component system response regulator HydG